MIQGDSLTPTINGVGRQTRAAYNNIAGSDIIKVEPVNIQ